MSKKKVVVGMSGGVDSSVAAALVKEQGYEVIGATLVLLPEECESERPDACCGIQAVDDARAVCDQIGIKHHTFNYRHIFRERIIDYFCSEYNAGRTPNPCVRCNRGIKFPALLYAADIIGAELLATGHMARLDKNSGVCVIRKGKDELKDQSYFLFELDQETLRRTILPLGRMTKDDTRRTARERGLHVHLKPESQEICFVKDDKYESFLREWIPDKLVPGPIYDTSEKQIGTHKGMQLYTIGQRRGLGIARGKPLYVLSIDAEKNSIVVGSDQELFSKGLIAEDLSWLPGKRPDKTINAEVKIRYNHTGVGAQITPVSECRVVVIFDEPQRAVAPGQAAVFYNGDILLGGGWIAGPVSRNQAEALS